MEGRRFDNPKSQPATQTDPGLLSQAPASTTTHTTATRASTPIWLGYAIQGWWV